MTETKSRLYAAPLNGEWQKSSFSDNSGDVCVRLMKIDGGVALGDSKRPDLTPLRYTRTELAAFLQAAKAGEFDHLLDD
ncbi:MULTISPECIES: DUF397 domain-containing protein [unclassified Streptomyces]|uniref:DUF397 domain-containing protein n=1 Tax=unclassified Streptomyces TaxID=2593676 RepID=UPI00190446AD|nr:MULTISPECIES: DUF397 domain-containing protein [unclassified Streptomyces]MCU4745358.1 DUF397 domain-containing protein [Streptomyces sp. G-5]QQN79627.1 DUF397 domain-containing protein [Streptomyces sp. XC 2026]